MLILQRDPLRMIGSTEMLTIPFSKLGFIWSKLKWLYPPNHSCKFTLEKIKRDIVESPAETWGLNRHCVCSHTDISGQRATPSRTLDWAQCSTLCHSAPNRDSVPPFSSTNLLPFSPPPLLKQQRSHGKPSHANLHKPFCSIAVYFEWIRKQWMFMVYYK